MQKIQIREGFGLTECVTASCLTPPHMAKEGSIGLPFPDTYYKIVEPGTDHELPYGEEGEILIAGPTVMMEYVNHPEETAQTLRKHDDGLTWMYTGDLGMMDDEGFIYFKGRAKRMIITSGYNVYPGQLENILDANEFVHMSCIIGVPDPYKMQKVKAFVMLKPGVPESPETKEAISPTAARTLQNTQCLTISSSAASCPRLLSERSPTASLKRKRPQSARPNKQGNNKAFRPSVYLQTVDFCLPICLEVTGLI